MTTLRLQALAARTANATPDVLLQDLLPALMAAVPAATTCQVYRLANEGMVVWHSLDADIATGDYQPLHPESPHMQAIKTHEPQMDQDTNTLIVPLLGDGQPFALLSVVFEDQPQAEFVLPLAQEISLLLYTRLLHTILDRQLTLTTDLSAAQSLTDVAETVARTMVSSGQFVTINVFEYKDEQLVGARATASASSTETSPLDLKIEVEAQTLTLMHDLLTRDGHILISEIEQEQRFSEMAIQWLQAQRARSLYVLPLYIDGQLYAFFTLIDIHRALAPSPLEMRLYQNVARQASAMIEKNNLIERNRQRAARSVEQTRIMRLLNDLIAAANVSNNEDDIFRRAVTVLQTTTDVDHVSVIVYRGDHVIIANEAPERGLVGQRLEFGEDPIAEILNETREPLLIDDVANDDRLPEANRALLSEANVRSVAFLPMFDADGVLLGTVNLDYDQSGQIDLDLTNTAYTIVQQVALAVQRVRLLSESRQQAEQLRRVTEFGQQLRAYLNRDEILKTALEYSDHLLGAQYMRIITYDRDAALLKVVAERFENQQSVTLPGTVLDLDADTIANEVWTTKQLVHVDDLSADWVWQHPRQRDLLSLIVMPLVSAGLLIGLVQVGHQQAQAFNAVDVTAFQQMGNQLSIALTNAEAYAQSQKLASHKTLANEIITRLQRQTDVDDILQLTVQELGKALNAKRARIRLGQPPQSSGDKA